MRHGPSPAAAIAAALAARAEEVCRRYLPHGRRQGRYWVAGDIDGARGRSLFVRLSGAGKPGKWTDAATGEHGDLLDLIRHRTKAPTLRAALDEARRFLALPAAPAAPSDAPYDATEAARRLWRRCRAVDGSHAERYLRARGLSRCRFAALRFHPALRYREGASVRRFPALVAAVTAGDGAMRPQACSAPGSIPARPPRRASRRRARRSAASTASRCASAFPPTTLRSSSGRASRRCSRWSPPCRRSRRPPRSPPAASARSRLRSGVARLVIARDNDEDGALAAERLARRCARAGVAATVIVPAGNDFNDDLVDLGAAALRARFAPLFRPAACAPGPRAARPGPRSGGGREERRVGQADRERGGRTCAPIVNLRTSPGCARQFEYAQVVNNTVLIDRRTKWGNPFRIGSDRTAKQVIARYRADLWRRIRAGEIALEELAELDGCWLACWCEPLPCHGHVLAMGVAAAGGARCATGGRRRVMSAIAFRRIAPDEFPHPARRRPCRRCLRARRSAARRRAVFRGASRRRPARSLPHP